MVKHIVMYTLRPDCNKTIAVETIREALENLVGLVPGLLKMEIRATVGGEFDYVLYSEFKDEAALEAYKTNPDHLAVKPTVHKYIKERKAADYIL